MEDNCLGVFDKNRKFTIKAKLSKNRTFCVVMKVASHQCFSLSPDKAEWLWHMRFDHLNFRYFSFLSKGSMVKGLPQISIPDTVCKECIQSKQTRGSFQKFLPQKSSAKLKSDHSDVCGTIQIETTAEVSIHLEKEPEEVRVYPIKYRKIVGSLRYLYNTRHDLCFNVGLISR